MNKIDLLEMYKKTYLEEIISKKALVTFYNRAKLKVIVENRMTLFL